MITYELFLDESGSFNDSKLPSHMNPSIVGGVLRKVSGNGSGSFQKKLRDTVGEHNHATELDTDFKVQQTSEVLSILHQEGFEFVVFENGTRKTIVDSTTSYLSVLTEGIIKLLRVLVTVHNGPVRIKAVIGFRKDTTKEITNSRTEGYIELGKYKTRLAERLEVEKIKLRNSALTASRIELWLSDDKSDLLLIAADYVCNFWLTRTIGKWQTDDGQKIREMFNEAYRFSLFRDEEDEYVLRILREGLYADAIFDLCSESISQTNQERVFDAIRNLSDGQLIQQLNAFAEYTKDYLKYHTENPLMIGKVLDNALTVCQRLRGKGKEIRKFLIDIQLYQLAYFNSRQDLERMAGIFSELEGEVVQYTQHTMDLEYLMIYYTRKAVYMQELRKYSECVAICESLELTLSDVGNAIEELCGDMGIDVSGKDMRSEHVGKVLGTKLQAQVWLCYQFRMDGNTEALNAERKAAKETSEQAISQFRLKEDQIRQFQYRAQLEAACGDLKSAVDWMEKSFGGVEWRQQIAASVYPFDIYNMALIAALCSKDDPDPAYEIADHIYAARQGSIGKGPGDDVIDLRIYLFLAVVYYRTAGKYERGRNMLTRLASYSAGHTGKASSEAERIYHSARLEMQGTDALHVLFLADDQTYRDSY